MKITDTTKKLFQKHLDNGSFSIIQLDQACQELSLDIKIGEDDLKELLQSAEMDTLDENLEKNMELLFNAMVENAENHRDQSNSSNGTSA